MKLSRRSAKKRAEAGRRDYNRQICPDFKLRRRCSNCKYWIRGAYFRDGQTPAKKGRCSLRIILSCEDCPLWTLGPTSWKKRPLLDMEDFDD